jgi:hypothetical protein
MHWRLWGEGLLMDCVFGFAITPLVDDSFFVSISWNAWLV